ncbi:MAG UNVERIFIED_CONTAM: hypothetical protein LVR29_30035 [Microcystis novacekii LVE1205-3]
MGVTELSSLSLPSLNPIPDRLVLPIGQAGISLFTGSIALFWGTTLTFCSLVNPALRTLNLAASTLALVIFSQRQVKLASLQDISAVFSPLPASHSPSWLAHPNFGD